MFLLEHVEKSTSNRPIRLPATKRHPVSKLNLTGPHFSRMLHGLDAAGVIAIEKCTITVKKPSKLRDMVLRSVKRRRRA